ncbi:MAG: transglycosylase SLT domain-containing protein [Halocynthiibacter sp.]
MNKNNTVLFYKFVLALLVMCALPLPAKAQKPQLLCEEAAAIAAQTLTIPNHVLIAVAHIESGTKKGNQIVSAPWVINWRGKGYWFDTKHAAISFAQSLLEDGKRNFDSGCFQINYRWHHTGFSSLEEIFDPEKNALYAARFLKSLYLEFGSWEKAVGAYHSRTLKHATKYIARFKNALGYSRKTAERIGSSAPRVSHAIEMQHLHHHPFLATTRRRMSLGSLVPSNHAIPPQAFFAPER